MESNRKIESKLAESRKDISPDPLSVSDAAIINGLRKYKNNYKLLRKYLLELKHPLTKEVLQFDLGKKYLLLHFAFSDVDLCKLLFRLTPKGVLEEVLLEQAVSGFNGLNILASAEKDNTVYLRAGGWQLIKENEAAIEKALLMRVMRGDQSNHLQLKVKDDLLLLELINLLSSEVINKLVLLGSLKTNILHIIIQQQKSQQIIDALVAKLTESTREQLFFMTDQLGIAPLGYACFPKVITPQSFKQADNKDLSCNMAGIYLLKHIQPGMLSKQISLFASVKSPNSWLSDKNLLECLLIYNPKLSDELMSKLHDFEVMNNSVKNESVMKSQLGF